MRIGIDLGGTKIEGVVMTAAGEIVKRLRVASPNDAYGDVVAAIAELVSQLQTAAELPADTVIGIGTPGAWQPDAAAMKNCNSTVLNGKPLLHDLTAALGERVRMANDADCFALSEAVDGAAKSAQTVFGVILGTGVGGGLVVNGALLKGPNAIAGEWGHTPVAYLRHAADRAPSDTAELLAQLPDRDCYCGRLNCVETFLSGPGIEQTAQQLLGSVMDATTIFATPSAAAVVELYCDLLAGSLAQVLNVIDPEVVVLGGGLSNQPRLYQRLPQLLPRYLFSPHCRTRVLPPQHGDSSGVRGAAWLWPAS